jgi:hypothetical protein
VWRVFQTTQVDELFPFLDSLAIWSHMSRSYRMPARGGSIAYAARSPLMSGSQTQQASTVTDAQLPG